MEFLSLYWMGEPVWMWLVFFAIVGGLLLLDLGVFHRKTHEVGIKESVWATVFYVVMALLFGGWIWYSLGATEFKDYLTGYVVEKTLSLDNIFVISMIFTYLGIPRLYQHRVLFWGILGVILLRGVMIGLGATLVHNFEWILFVFAAFLIVTGIRMLLQKQEGHVDIENNRLLKFLRNHFKITENIEGDKFTVKRVENGKSVRYITPLLVALILIEAADVLFAVDSIPAIFSITTNPYIVFTSNLFAILGLRALFFCLAAMVEAFAYLKVAISWVLIFIGLKVFSLPVLEHFWGIEKFPSSISLGVTLGLLAWGVLWSIYRRKHPKLESAK